MNNNYALKKKVTVYTKVWKPNLDVTLPIDGEDIPGFREWVNWNGFSKDHIGFDFASYLNNSNECVLGLPHETPVRAITDGMVAQVFSPSIHGEYAVFINIEHGKEGSGLFSCYHHVKPAIKYGQPVKKGDVIATLYKDSGNKEGRLVHLHFLLTNAWEKKPREIDPLYVFPGLAEQRSKDFKISKLSPQPHIRIANFKDLRV